MVGETPCLGLGARQDVGEVVAERVDRVHRERHAASKQHLREPRFSRFSQVRGRGSVSWRAIPSEAARLGTTGGDNMPRYYCDYCDVYLTHDSAAVRKAHNTGRKHKVRIVSPRVAVRFFSPTHVLCSELCARLLCAVRRERCPGHHRHAHSRV